MKSKDVKQLHDKSEKELKEMLKKAKEELIKLKMELATRKLKNSHLLMEKRHDISRIKTIIREKEFLK